MCVASNNASAGSQGSTASDEVDSNIGGIMMAAQLASSYLGQQSATELQQIRNDALEKSAQRALKIDQGILLRRTQQEREAYAQSNFDLQRRAMELEATANVSAGEAGVSGISVEALTSNIRRQAGEVGVRSKKSYENRLDSLEDSHTKSVQNMVARIQGLPPVTQPNLLAIALNVGSQYITADNIASADAWFDDTFGGTNG